MPRPHCTRNGRQGTWRNGRSLHAPPTRSADEPPRTFPATPGRNRRWHVRGLLPARWRPSSRSFRRAVGRMGLLTVDRWHGLAPMSRSSHRNWWMSADWWALPSTARPMSGGTCPPSAEIISGPCHLTGLDGKRFAGPGEQHGALPHRKLGVDDSPKLCVKSDARCAYLADSRSGLAASDRARNDSTSGRHSSTPVPNIPCPPPGPSPIGG